MSGMSMEQQKIRVGILGTGKWTLNAHLPAFARCNNTQVIAICGHDPKRTQEVANRFDIQYAFTDHHDLLECPDIDMIDITTSTSRHYSIALDALEIGKPILCEKPLAMTYKEARILAEKANKNRVHTKMGYIFRHSPVFLRMKELIEEGFIGDPYIFNGYEQNSQFIDPMTPFRWNPSDNPNKIIAGSLEEYGSHLIDFALWLMGDLKNVVGLMKNHIPNRKIRDRGNKIMPINIDDGTIFMGEFHNNAQATFQSSFVAIGGYPGAEVRIYGSKGAIIGRCVEEFGIGETLKIATPDNIEFQPVDIPDRLYPPDYSKNESWRHLYFGNLVQSFVNDILVNQEPECNFQAGAKSLEVQEAVYLSHLKKKWISIPLE